jgi:hypothetical protein
MGLFRNRKPIETSSDHYKETFIDGAIDIYLKRGVFKSDFHCQASFHLSAGMRPEFRARLFEIEKAIVKLDDDIKNKARLRDDR